MTAAIAATAGRDERTNAEKSTDEDMTGLVIVTTIAAIVVATTKINYRSDKQSYVSVPAYLREPVVTTTGALLVLLLLYPRNPRSSRVAEVRICRFPVVARIEGSLD